MALTRIFERRCRRGCGRQGVSSRLLSDAVEALLRARRRWGARFCATSSCDAGVSALAEKTGFM